MHTNVRIQGQMESFQQHLDLLVDEIQEQVNNAVRAALAIRNSVAAGDSFPMERLCAAVAFRMARDNQAFLLQTCCFLNALSDVIRDTSASSGDRDAAKAILEYFFERMHPERLFFVPKEVPASKKTKIIRFVKGWKVRGVITQEVETTLLKALNGEQVLQPSQTAAVEPSVSTPESSSSNVTPTLTSSQAEEILVVVKKCLDTLPKFPPHRGEYYAKIFRRQQNQLRLDAPGAVTAALLRSLLEEMSAELALTQLPPPSEVEVSTAGRSERPQCRNFLEAVQSRRARKTLTSNEYDDDSRKEPVAYATALQETDVLATQLLADRCQLSLSDIVRKRAEYFHPKREREITRPFKVPVALSSSRGGAHRTWGLSDESWLLQKDMTKVPIFVLRGAGGTGIEAASENRKRGRDVD